MLHHLFRGRVRSDYQVSYYKGSTVRRVERGCRVEWFLDGTPVTEERAKAYMVSQEAA